MLQEWAATMHIPCGWLVGNAGRMMQVQGNTPAGGGVVYVLWEAAWRLL
jgi:hypothetical protein